MFLLLADSQNITVPGLLSLLACLAACFLLGAIPFGYLIGRWRGVDIRKSGSGNIGATNAFRVLGKKWGSVVFVLDFLKAWVPLFFLMRSPFLQPYGSVFSPDLVLLLCGIAVVLGHNYTPFLGFKGGKGITSSAGVLLALMPVAFLCAALAWTILFYSTRYVSVASIGASLVLPMVAAGVYLSHPLFVVLSVLMSVLSLWRHRGNMQRLWRGTENRFKKKDS